MDGVFTGKKRLILPILCLVCGYPNDDSVYYYVEQFAHNFTLQTVHTSEVYKNAAELPYDGFSELIDITSSIISL